MRSVNVVQPGQFTTVQDAGRPGYQRYGLPPSGAMDRCAFETANALVENGPKAAVLECTGTMPVLQFNHAARVSVVYADRFQTLEISDGETMRFQPLETGYRAYIAVEGGVDVPVVMGSRSTYMPGKLGGFEGRTLRAGDVLKVGQASCQSARAERRTSVDRQDASPTLRVIPGPEADWFDCGGLNTFLTEPFIVSSKSDRTGNRLEGSSLSFRHDEQMVSSGLAMGAIQVPPSGLPMIMMADHPTTGGYPRIGTVVIDDFSLLAQLRPGDLVRFIEAD